MEDVYYSYLTNNETLGTIDVPKLYSKRWEIGKFFKELRNHWNIRNFPSISPFGHISRSCSSNSWF
ncbi:hypothetical protein CW714_07615 [Methanophagales archaeon]|nr:MAG: hypothetical protein CW714_07615 [Methanophagales archaeon]